MLSGAPLFSTHLPRAASCNETGPTPLPALRAAALFVGKCYSRSFAGNLFRLDIARVYAHSKYRTPHLFGLRS